MEIKLKKIIGDARFHFSWDRHSFVQNDGVPFVSNRKAWKFKFDFKWGNPNTLLGVWMIFETPLFTGGIYA